MTENKTSKIKKSIFADRKKALLFRTYYRKQIICHRFAKLCLTNASFSKTRFSMIDDIIFFERKKDMKKLILIVLSICMLGVLLTACSTSAGDPPITIETGEGEIVMHTIVSQPASGFENEFVQIHQDSAKEGDVVVFEAERITDATVAFMVQGKQTRKEYAATFVNNDGLWDTYEFTMPDEDIVITSWLDNQYFAN